MSGRPLHGPLEIHSRLGRRGRDWAWRTAIESEIGYRLLRALHPPRRWLPQLRRASHAQGVSMGPPENAEERRIAGKPQW